MARGFMAIEKPDWNIRLTRVDASDVQKYSAELEDQLNDTVRTSLKGRPEISLPRIYLTSAPGSNTQDPASILALVLGSTFAVEIAKGLAKGIADYLGKRPDLELEMVKPDGTFIRLKCASSDAASILKFFGH